MKNTVDRSYDDIISLPHHQSAVRAHMSMRDRAAQFAPFAALTGYGEEVAETARLTDRKIELSEEQLDELNARINLLKDKLNECPEICITFFIADDKKNGGAYQEIIGVVKKIDNYARMIEMENGDIISVDNIYSIEDTESQRFFGCLE